MLSDYSSRFRHFTVSLAQESDYGQQVPTTDFAGAYWGYLTYKSATQPIIEGAKNEVVEAEIVIHNYPGISVSDRLKYMWTDELFDVVGITYGDNETICACRKIQEGILIASFSDGFSEGFQ